MKLVKEYINEKFIEDSDPIKDMSIGIINKLNKWLKKYGIEKEEYIKNFRYARELYSYDAILAIICSEEDINEKDKLDLVIYLVEQKSADVKGNGSLALRWACSNGDLSVVKYLIKMGANPNDMDEDNSLSCAITYNQKDVVKYLLSINTEITTQDNKKWLKERKLI